MIVLTTSTAEQTFSVKPREYVTDATICLRDDSTNIEECVLTTGIYWDTKNIDWELATQNWEEQEGLEVTNDLLYVTMNLDLVEGRFYDLKMTGTATAKVSAAATVDIGTSSTGLTNVKGSMVMIN